MNFPHGTLSQIQVDLMLSMLVLQLPLEAVMNHVLEVPAIKECFQKAANIGDPDALFLALKLQERVPIESEMSGKLLPSPFSPDTFFTRDHLSNLVPCFKVSFKPDLFIYLWIIDCLYSY